MREQFFRLRATHLGSAIGISLLASLVSITVAQDAPPPNPFTTPAAGSQRPIMPTTFDKATVEQLIRDIDLPQQASILKVGYFMRRSSEALPVAEGFALLKAAGAAEPVGTRRWFRIQNLLGVAAFRDESIATDDGFAAYTLLFDHASEAAASKAEYPLWQSISEWIATANGRLKDLGLGADERSREVTLKAWKAYIRLDRSKLSPTAPEPDFAAAFITTNAEEEAGRLVIQALNDKTVPRSYTLLSTGAKLVGANDPKRAIALLREAKTVLPQKAVRLGSRELQLDVNEAARLYDRLVTSLTQEKLPTEAIMEQRERIAKIGSGYGDLWVLLRGNDVEQKAVVESLKNPALKGRLVLREVVDMLGAAKGTQDNDGVAKEILTPLLTPGRELSVDDEIEIRTALGHVLWRDKDVAQAQTVTEMKKPEGLTALQLSLWQALEKFHGEVTQAPK